MTSLKQLAMYCRDYIDPVSPSQLSRGAKQILIPKDILDATLLHERREEFDYESLALELDLAPQLEQLSYIPKVPTNFLHSAANLII